MLLHKNLELKVSISFFAVLLHLPSICHDEVKNIENAGERIS